MEGGREGRREGALRKTHSVIPTMTAMTRMTSSLLLPLVFVFASLPSLPPSPPSILLPCSWQCLSLLRRGEVRMGRRRKRRRRRRRRRKGGRRRRRGSRKRGREYPEERSRRI